MHAFDSLPPVHLESNRHRTCTSQKVTAAPEERKRLIRVVYADTCGNDGKCKVFNSVELNSRLRVWQFCNEISMASLSYFAAKRHRAIFIDPLLHALPHVIAQSRKPP